MFSEKNLDLDLRWDFKSIFNKAPDWLGIIPARVNLLGTHVEHGGGYVNTLAVDHHLHLAAGYRDDKVIYARNRDPAFGEVKFSLEEMIPSSLVSWEEQIRSQYIESGDWGNYIRAVCAYFALIKGPQLRRGLNLYISGKIPVAAGLSSSSSLVVAMTLLLSRAHGWVYSHEEMVKIAGCSEWFVGTRGGWSDHAAMIFGKQDHLAHFCFSPFRLSYYSFPEELSVICAQSMSDVKNSAQSRGIFNQRNACYQIGLKLVHKNFPDLKKKCRYIRDINPHNLGNEELAYEILLSLPQTMHRSDIYKALPEEKEFLDTVFSSHSKIEPYFIRDVMGYGIAECERSRIGSELMKNRKYDEFGKLMFISHDGNRVSSWRYGYKTPWKWRTTDDEITNHVKNARTLFAKGVSSIAHIPGAYHCSTPELDFIVDTLKNVPYVLGAKLTGTALGGSVLILVKKEHTEDVISLLEKKYYKPRNLPARLFICRSVDGARIQEVRHALCR